MTVGIEALWYQFDYLVDLGAAGGNDGNPGNFNQPCQDIPVPDGRE